MGQLEDLKMMALLSDLCAEEDVMVLALMRVFRWLLWSQRVLMTGPPQSWALHVEASYLLHSLPPAFWGGWREYKIRKVPNFLKFVLFYL